MISAYGLCLLRCLIFGFCRDVAFGVGGFGRRQTIAIFGYDDWDLMYLGQRSGDSVTDSSITGGLGSIHGSR